jgi:hypothetical protein
MLITIYPPPIPGLGRDAPGSASGYLRRQWIRGAWCRGSWKDRIGFPFGILLWWPTTILHAAYLAIRLGPSRSRISGKSPLRQFIEQIEVAAKWMVPPLWYYTFEFFDDERRAHAADYLQRVQVKPFLYRWLIDRKQRRDSDVPFASKVHFSKLCRQRGLRAGTVIATVGVKGIGFVDRTMTSFPPGDLFVKIKLGRGGRGAEKWSYASGAYRDAAGRSLTKAEFADHLTRRASLRKRVVEYYLTNHEALADLTLGALATARILTVRDEHGGIEATHAVFRMPQRPGALVDNIHAGGIAAPVDLATGRLGRATDLGVSVDSAWHAVHPVTGAAIEGRVLPLWPDALELVKRAHDLIGDRVVVGWDVAILADGPCLIEGNGKPDVDLIQRPHRTGLGNSRFGALLQHHLKNARAGDISNGRRPDQFGTWNR